MLHQFKVLHQLQLTAQATNASTVIDNNTWDSSVGTARVRSALACL